jgi:hypothetical protein
MAEQLNIPNSPACGQWETLLADALDGTLRPEDEGEFSNHMATCPSCAELFEQARQGREWLEFLAPEPEVPAALLERILAETGTMDRAKLAVAGGPELPGNVIPMPIPQRLSFAARLRRLAEPRLLMTAAMAFFSIGLTLSLTGVRITGIKMVDLRPSAVRSQLEKRIMTASTPIIRYYDHLRFVYEMESTMRQLRQSAQPEQQPSQPSSQPKPQQGQPGGDGQTHKKDGGSTLNPKNAPQQTVNPPARLWSADMLETRLELPHLQPDFSTTKGFSKHSQASETVLEAGIEERVLAIPMAISDRSTVCRA